MMNAAQGASTATATATATATSWRVSRLWRRGGFLLAGAAQLITISALVSADPIAATWASLLLAIAPAPLAAAGAFLPARLARPATMAALLVILVGIIGAFHPAGVLFIPAFLVLLAGAALQWRELG
jgi:hypothetical protein